MNKIIIDAEGSVFGRLCSFAAKKAIDGNEVIVINSEKTIITGNKENIIDKHLQSRRRVGHSQKGPKVSKYTYLILKRGILGMIPNHREGFGRQVAEKIKCYDGVPKEFQGQKFIKAPGQTKNKFIVLNELVKRI